jgi:monofunctional biosynthetic peptidoglycan transglycosylase
MPHDDVSPWAVRRRVGLVVAAFLVLIIILVVADFAWTWKSHEPRIAALVSEDPGTTSYMNRAARAGHRANDRDWVTLGAVAPVAACAVILSEDGQFFNIGTINYDIQRQMLSRVLRGDFSRGGSGFAQQLARNLFLGPQRTPRRKAREYLLAYQLSHALTKERQLEIYLNIVEWGDGIWGIGAASAHYFGLPPDQLAPAQSVILASLLPAPRLEVRFALTERAARKAAAITRGLTRTMLIDDLARGATIERLKLWRTAVAGGLNAADAFASVESVMGREPLARALAGTDSRPIREACNGRRRPA